MAEDLHRHRAVEHHPAAQEYRDRAVWQRTGGLIASPALLLVIVVGLFSASGITFLKLLGVGMMMPWHLIGGLTSR